MKLFIMNTTLAFALAALWAGGYLPISGIGLPPFLTLWFITAIGVTCIATGRRDAAQLIMSLMTALGLLGTSIGLATVLADYSQEDAQSMVHGMALAFYSTIAAMAGFIWLRLCLFVTRI